MSAAQPLKTPSRATSDVESTSDKTPRPPANSKQRAVPPTNVTEITSPHELTAFVETLLEQLDSKFDDMSTQILDRMTQMSARVDSLEASIQDIINGDVPSVPTSPSASGPSMRRSESNST